MKVYHRTNASMSILSDGFRDGRGKYMTESVWTGVWFSDRPLLAHDGYWHGDVLLTFEIPEQVFVEYEWCEEGKSYRESLIPAAIANTYGPPMVVTSEEWDGVELAHGEQTLGPT